MNAIANRFLDLGPDFKSSQVQLGLLKLESMYFQNKIYMYLIVWNMLVWYWYRVEVVWYPRSKECFDQMIFQVKPSSIAPTYYAGTFFNHWHHSFEISTCLLSLVERSVEGWNFIITSILLYVIHSEKELRRSRLKLNYHQYKCLFQTSEFISKLLLTVPPVVSFQVSSCQFNGKSFEN